MASALGLAWAWLAWVSRGGGKEASLAAVGANFVEQTGAVWHNMLTTCSAALLTI